MTVVVDVSDVTKELKRIERKVAKTSREAVKKAQALMADELEKQTPVYSKKKYKGKRGDYMKYHAKNHVVITNIKDGYGEVGYDSDVGWRMHMTEFGTIKYAPRGFAQKALNSVEDEIMKIMSEAIAEVVK